MNEQLKGLKNMTNLLADHNNKVTNKNYFCIKSLLITKNNSTLNHHHLRCS